MSEHSKKEKEPGDEGFVHMDGTLQSERQTEENDRAAADRDAVGSVLHGAPANGPKADEVLAEKLANSAKVAKANEK